MYTLINYIKEFTKETFSFSTYGLVAFFLGITIPLNYYFEIEDVLIDKEPNKVIQFLLYLAMYSFAYYGTLLIIFFTKRMNFFSSKEVMIKSILAILILAFDGTFSVTTEFLKFVFSFKSDEAIYARRLINQAMPSLIYLTIIYFIKRKYDEKMHSLYGITSKGFSWMPYSIMLVCMLPLLAWASLQEDFIIQYPYYKFWNYSPVFGLSQIKLFALFELFYLVDFINVELLFRGLLVVGMARMMGKEAILPMVVTYAFLHFGKPPIETISSIFGGYILGIIAYKTNNILGGYFIHMGVALLMDLFALFQILSF